MFLCKKKHVEVPDDTGEAQVIREEARQEIESLEARAPLVTYLVQQLAKRRLQNHFGEEIQITFRPRGGHL